MSHLKSLFEDIYLMGAESNSRRFADFCEGYKAAGSAWQPIETAPKDGTGVLLYCEKSLRVPVTGGYWDDHPKCRCWIAGGYMQRAFPPTHWMPLPKTPNDKINRRGHRA